MDTRSLANDHDWDLQPQWPANIQRAEFRKAAKRELSLLRKAASAKQGGVDETIHLSKSPANAGRLKQAVLKVKTTDQLASWAERELTRATLPKPRQRKRTLIPEYAALMARKPSNDVLDDLNEVRGDR